ncbi:unnamed protein product [Urochloa decumbens]|uniref:NB-ARC domain-containing protein n=1 Tax=Urochloa decumbens TaxID=240449 RepID=A0ABC9C3S4_9POAL
MMGIVTKATTRHEIGQEIKDIRERVKEVAERRDRYNVDAIRPANTMVDPRITSLYTKATDLVGIDEAIEELITRLTKGDDMSVQKQRIVSIVGFGGLGKTTLAKAVHDKLKKQFDCTAFVSVSQNPDLNKLLKNMLYELDKEKYANVHSQMLEEKHLIDQLREFLQNKRYNVDAIRPANTMVDPRITSLYTKATDLVGIDEAIEELITRLTKGDDMSVQKQRIVSIVGFGGLGKTTLAKAVHDKLKKQFDCTAFVSVSQNPDLNKLLKNMLYELDKEKYANVHSQMLEEKHLIDQLREFLQNKRVVLKDNKEGRWDDLCAALVVSLGKLHKIQTLLVTSDDVAVDLDGSVESLGNLQSYLRISGTRSQPTWINPASLLLLSFLDITMVEVRKEDIQALGMLQALRYLVVSVCGKTLQVLGRFTVGPDAFPCAIRCELSGFSTVPSMFPPGAMPRLEEFRFCIGLEDFSEGEFVADDLALGHLPSIQRVDVGFLGQQTVGNEELIAKVQEKLRHEADIHPNHPSINL